MFKLYIYKNIKDEDLVVCSGEDYTNLFSLLKDIKLKWDSINRETPAKFLFDLFLTNGNSSNRFAYLDYDGKAFIANSYKIANPSEIDSELLEIQNRKYEDFA